MRRAGVLATLALTVTVALAGCNWPHNSPPPRVGGAGVPAATTKPTPTPSKATSEVAAIYIAVLKRFLTSGDSSFSEPFPVAYVLDKTHPDAANPAGPTAPANAVPINEADQASILAATKGATRVEFIADRNSVLEFKDRCAVVRNGGILIVLAPPKGKAPKVTVGIEGYVACLGAVWFTYVVKKDANGWHTAGKTGAEAIA